MLEIAKASGIRTRPVVLDARWWQTDQGPLLAYRAEQKAPVALLPVSATRYDLFDPSTRATTPVTAAVAATLAPGAVMFYAPFGERAVTGARLLAFGLRACGPDLWRLTLTIAGGRLTGGDNIYWRIAQFLMPVHCYAPSAMPGENIFGQSFIPVTDTNCWIYTYVWNPERPLTQAERDAFDRGNGVISEVDENYVPLRNRANDYLIDRKLQKTKSYTGIIGVSEQDAAVQDSQGPIADRTREHLGPTDLGILHFRKMVMDAARALQQCKPPPHLAHPDRYAVRSGACVTNKAKELAAVMVERFGDASGFVGRPRTAAAE